MSVICRFPFCWAVVSLTHAFPEFVVVSEPAMFDGSVLGPTCERCYTKVKWGEGGYLEICRLADEWPFDVHIARP